MEFIQIILNYLIHLDWSYIITLIIICYFITGDKAVIFIPSEKLMYRLLNVPKGWRVLIIGISYAAFLFWLRKLQRSDVENLLQSLIFAFVFYELILKVLNNSINSWLDKENILPKR